MKTTKGGKVMNPTDAYRKELRKKELKRNKKERKKVREVGILKKDPEAIREQIRKLETMKADGALDKTRRHKKRQLEDTLKLVLKKRKEYEEKMREKGEEPIMFSHLSAPRRRTAEEEQKAKQMRPEDSVYYHPTLNPTGAPPPGKPPMYKSSIGSSVPLSEDGDLESEMVIPIPPPPPLPMAEGSSSAEDQALIPLAVPVPPPPPAPPRPSGTAIPSLPPPPPPPPGAPPKARAQILPPPPPPLPRQMQPPPPGTGTIELAGPPGIEETSEKLSNHERLPAPKQEGKSEQTIEETQDMDVSQIPPASLAHQAVNSLPLPPPPPPPSMMRPLQGSVQHIPSHDMLPSGMPRLPPPPPPGLRPPLSGPSFPPRSLPTGVPMGHPPPLGPIPPPLGRILTGMSGVPLAPMALKTEVNPLDDSGKAVKASFVKSAAPTVVKRPLAQHTPELTSMVPASVLVRRETAQKLKSKSSTSHSVVNATKIPVSQTASRPQSIDDSYSAFLEDMKALGAFDGDFS